MVATARMVVVLYRGSYERRTLMCALATRFARQTNSISFGVEQKFSVQVETEIEQFMILIILDLGLFTTG